MRLIGAGLPRTGTLTQKVALEMLEDAPDLIAVLEIGVRDMEFDVPDFLHRSLLTAPCSLLAIPILSSRRSAFASVRQAVLHRTAS